MKNIAGVATTMSVKCF